MASPGRHLVPVPVLHRSRGEQPEHHRAAQGSRRVVSQIWPDGRASAACFTFDLDAEEVWIADEQADDRPGVLSQGTYGPKVAVPLILDILRRHRVAATFFVPGRVAER